MKHLVCVLGTEDAQKYKQKIQDESTLTDSCAVSSLVDDYSLLVIGGPLLEKVLSTPKCYLDLKGLMLNASLSLSLTQETTGFIVKPYKKH